MFKTIVGEAGCTHTYQGTFPKAVDCPTCGAEGAAKIAFVAREVVPVGRRLTTVLVKDLAKKYMEEDSEHDILWLHGVCAVAVYFCTKCLNVTCRANQA